MITSIATQIVKMCVFAGAVYVTYEVMKYFIDKNEEIKKDYYEEVFKEYSHSEGNSFKNQNATSFQNSNNINPPPSETPTKYNEYDKQKYKRDILKTLNSRVEPIINSNENPYLKMRGYRK